MKKRNYFIMILTNGIILLLICRTIIQKKLLKNGDITYLIKVARMKIYY